MKLHFVLAEREYRCLGKFTERGLTYTYTERRDVLGYECFVGVIISEGELFIKEAGEHCQRDVEPLRLGMKLTRQGNLCTDLVSIRPYCLINVCLTATCYAPRPSSKPNAIATLTSTVINQHPSIIDANGVHRPASSLPPHNPQPSTVKPWVPTITGTSSHSPFIGHLNRY